MGVQKKVNSKNSKEKKGSQTDAGLAGAGGGTLVAVIANQLPDGNIAKPTLNYLAPSIAIVVTALWVWMQVKIVNYSRDRDVKRLIKQIRKELQERIADPRTSEEHRDTLSKELEEFDLLSIQRIKDKMKALDVFTSGDIEKSNKS